MSETYRNFSRQKRRVGGREHRNLKEDDAGTIGDGPQGSPGVGPLWSRTDPGWLPREQKVMTFVFVPPQGIRRHPWVGVLGGHVHPWAPQSSFRERGRLIGRLA